VQLETALDLALDLMPELADEDRWIAGVSDLALEPQLATKLLEASSLRTQLEPLQAEEAGAEPAPFGLEDEAQEEAPLAIRGDLQKALRESKEEDAALEQVKLQTFPFTVLGQDSC